MKRHFGIFNNYFTRFKGFIANFAAVKKEQDIKKISTILSVWGLALLLLLVPCKVRNFIEAELDLPQSKVLNKSQTTLSEADCFNYELSEAVQSTGHPSFQPADLLLQDTRVFSLHAQTHPYSPDFSENAACPEIPLYILYQNFKAYL